MRTLFCHALIQFTRKQLDVCKSNIIGVSMQLQNLDRTHLLKQMIVIKTIIESKFVFFSWDIIFLFLLSFQLFQECV